MRRLFSIVLMLVVLAGCQGGGMSDNFKLDSTLRMEIKGYITFMYNPLTCQLSYNPEEYEFRVHTDNMSDFYMLRLDELPNHVGQVVNGTASWTTGDDLHTKKTTFEAIKFEGGKIWFWSASSRIALVVQVLR
ncbi:MAG: hypothetical protein J6X25_02855 [Bacteroidales bacterium]|nr:hypothetical protein [Bacteroidales bacterium]